MKGVFDMEENSGLRPKYCAKLPEASSEAMQYSAGQVFGGKDSSLQQRSVCAEKTCAFTPDSPFWHADALPGRYWKRLSGKMANSSALLANSTSVKLPAPSL